MRLLPRIVFATLVIATFAAFFVTQRLKAEPGVFATFGVPQPVFSPNQDGRNETAILAFAPREADRVDVSVVDRDGDVVKELQSDVALDAGQRLEVRWDGTDEAERPVPDGTYRFQVALRRQGRAVVVPRNLTKDTRPPRPRVLSIGPAQSRDAQGRRIRAPELLPRADGRPARVTVFAPGDQPEVAVYRTDVRPARLVLEDELERPGQSRWEWDGTVDGELVPSGTYLVVARSRDRAGNIGQSAPTDPGYGEELPGRGGIEVRRLAVGPPSGPVEAGGRASFGVVAGGERYRWRVRRVGERRPRSDGGGTRSPLTVRAPRGRSGLYLMELTARPRRTRGPFAVQGGAPGSTSWSSRRAPGALGCPSPCRARTARRSSSCSRPRRGRDATGSTTTATAGRTRSRAGGPCAPRASTPAGCPATSPTTSRRCSSRSTGPGAATTSRRTSRSPAGRARGSTGAAA